MINIPSPHAYAYTAHMAIVETRQAKQAGPDSAVLAVFGSLLSTGSKLQPRNLKLVLPWYRTARATPTLPLRPGPLRTISMLQNSPSGNQPQETKTTCYSVGNVPSQTTGHPPRLLGEVMIAAAPCPVVYVQSPSSFSSLSSHRRQTRHCSRSRPGCPPLLGALSTKSDRQDKPDTFETDCSEHSAGQTGENRPSLLLLLQTDSGYHLSTLALTVSTSSWRHLPTASNQ
ncbi:hypothetical protein B0T20DRAFT_98060 [Sordaria brevicollis]|uniref:Uncharacterized protein n=1 Tax=Sordaria brevicollis TaxID=83679 RepID=A0AAE0NVU6_SORBR|nr:hypothetical protein B0T20DRAFT_98060 [Sordaria brevicollis]